ncbi:MAG: flippase-like domain-containing protein [Firmicutes bacterium]|nr:flippase-like domain-containing protein [Bacillota bacterium]
MSKEENSSLSEKTEYETHACDPGTDRPVRIGLTLKSLLIDLCIFGAVLTLTVFMIFRQVSPRSMLHALQSVRTKYIYAGLGMMGIYFLLQSINIKRLAAVFEMEVSFRRALKYALAGFFFSSVTPASTGGKPMQIYYMHRDGYSVSKSTMALIYEVMNYELVMALYASAGFIFRYRQLTEALGRIRFALILGITVNIMVVVMLILSIFSARTIDRLTGILVRITSVFARKKAKAMENRIRQTAGNYEACAVYLKKNRSVMASTFVIAVFQLFAMFSIPYFVYLGFGIEAEFGVFEIVALEAVAYVSLVFLPVPGAIGASEGVFILVFRIVFPAGLVMTAMLLSRCLSYYLILMITGLFTALFSLLRNKRTVSLSGRDQPEAG